MYRKNAFASMPSRSATLSATVSERMIFSPSLAASPAATFVPREPISLVIAITVMVASYLLCWRWTSRLDWSSGVS
jgi:hypothetical protein